MNLPAKVLARNIFLAALMIGACLGVYFLKFHKRLISKEEALVKARQVPEVQAFYALEGGRFAGCIQSEVLEPCESQWVTCIEEAWVVKFSFGEACGAVHDGRLSVTLLLDAKDGRLISKFPEVEYFETPLFCREAFDCVETQDGRCLNFVFGQIAGGKDSSACRCEAGRCQK